MIAEISYVLDAGKLERRVVALVNLKDRLSIPPDVIYQVVLDPFKFSPSRKFIHLDQRTQLSDVHGWFPVESIVVLEILRECGDEKKDQGPVYAELLKEAA